jgi:hypothetical protein
LQNQGKSANGVRGLHSADQPEATGVIMSDTITALTAIASIFISALTFGWTIYRDVVQKPRFRASAAIKTIVQQGREPDGPYLFVEALNLGPIANRLGLVLLRPGWWSRKMPRWLSRKDNRWAGGVVMADHAHPATTQAGKRLEVGDQGTFVIPMRSGGFLDEKDWMQIGVSDGFGRMHWAPRSDVKALRKRYRELLNEGRVQPLERHDGD